MLIHKRLLLRQVVRVTWKVDLLMLMLCILAYYVDTKLIPEVNIPTGIPALMGTAIAFFIGFNNHQAYDRWWEARIIWGGLVNDSRSWVRSLIAYCCDPLIDGAAKDHSYERKMIQRHLGFLYALKSALRNSKEEDYKKYCTNDEVVEIEKSTNKANKILDMQAVALEKLKRENIIDNFQFLVLTDLLKNFCDGMGKSERIKNTVFPTTYIYFTRLFIWTFVILLTMSISLTIGLWSIFFGWVMGFVFHITHINGLSLMNPFEDEPSGVPISSITRTIEINLLQALGEKEIPEPIAAVNGEYIM
ncbi:MAG TPA: bestrophin family ion channel [Chryseolinea sp.]|nr:bestrophin family ion channel [Chryseolinea sp.]